MATLRVPAVPELAPMKVAQISKPGGDFEIVEREIPMPAAGHVRIKVKACGVCHSDVLTREGSWPGIQYPRVPGHEVAGVIDEVGGGVSVWQKGQRVGVGWHGGHDSTCRECRRGIKKTAARRSPMPRIGSNWLSTEAARSLSACSFASII